MAPGAYIGAYEKGREGEGVPVVIARALGERALDVADSPEWFILGLPPMG